MMLGQESHFYSKKKERNFVFLYSMLSILVVSGILIGLAYAILFSRLFKVSSLKVEGIKLVSKEELLSSVESYIISRGFVESLLGPDNILFWKIGSGYIGFTPIIPSISYISVDVNIKTKQVTISVKERNMYGIWCVSENGCFAFDDAGVVFARAPVPEGVLVTRIENLNKREPVLGSLFLPDTEWIRNLFQTLYIVKKEGIPVSNVLIKDYGLKEWEIMSPLGFSIYASLDFVPQNLDSVLKNITAKVDLKNLSYMDFRIPNRLFYK